MKTNIWRLQVILKTIERCNLACTYCYYFEMGDTTFSRQPPAIASETIEAVSEYLADACKEHRVGTLMVVFHGGEPTMQKKSDFDHACLTIRSRCEGVAQVQFSIQTNAVLLDQDWLDLFSKHSVAVGVSIDGLQHQNDEFRLDVHGKGSYVKARRGIERLVAASNCGAIPPIGSISVINPKWNYREISKHLFTDLGIKIQSYLLPDCTHDSAPTHAGSIELYSAAFQDLFAVWCECPDLRIEQIDQIVERYQLQMVRNDAPQSTQPRDLENGDIYGGPRFTPGRNQIIVIQSSGEVTIDDSLIPIGDLRRTIGQMNVRETSFSDFLNDRTTIETERMRQTIPRDCWDCSYRGVCRGGDMENRYSTTSGFDNKSVFCAALMSLHKCVQAYIEQHGYPAWIARDVAQNAGLQPIGKPRSICKEPL